VPTLKERVDKHDREIAAIRKLMIQGMKMLIDFQRENRQAFKELLAAQKKTEAAQKKTEETLDRFIRSLTGRGTNGHSKSKIDLR
jgi:NCAIR mutase (PurE)-related protein